MSFENRGGIPIVRRLVIDTTGTAGPTNERGYRFPAVIKWLQISNEGSDSIRVYFTDADFVANANYIVLDATTGFFEGPVEASHIWLRAENSSSDPVVLVMYARRG